MFESVNAVEGPHYPFFKSVRCSAHSLVSLKFTRRTSYFSVSCHGELLVFFHWQQVFFCVAKEQTS